MSNRNERNRNRTTKRLTKLFGPDARVTWNNRVACIWSPAFQHQDVYARAEGMQWHLTCPTYEFSWSGRRLLDGINQLKTLQLINPIDNFIEAWP